MASTLPNFSPTFGGDSGPAMAEVGGGDVISQGGLNVPAYPDFYSLAPVDSDLIGPVVSRQDQPLVFAVMGIVFFLALIKKKK